MISLFSLEEPKIASLERELRRVDKMYRNEAALLTRYGKLMRTGGGGGWLKICSQLGTRY